MLLQVELCELCPDTFVKHLRRDSWSVTKALYFDNIARKSPDISSQKSTRGLAVKFTGRLARAAEIAKDIFLAGSMPEGVTAQNIKNNWLYSASTSGRGLFFHVTCWCMTASNAPRSLLPRIAK